MFRSMVAMFFGILPLALPASAGSITFDWTGAGGSSSWSDPANWTPDGGPPMGCGQAARLRSWPLSYTVDFDLPTADLDYVQLNDGATNESITLLVLDGTRLGICDGGHLSIGTLAAVDGAGQTAGAAMIDGVFENYGVLATLRPMLPGEHRYLTLHTPNSTVTAVGSVNQAGGTLAAWGGTTLSLENAGQTVNRGRIVVEPGGRLESDSGFVQIAGSTEIDGTFDINSPSDVRPLELQGGWLGGTGDVFGSVANAGGELRPGGLGGVGCFHIHGTYSQRDSDQTPAHGTLAIELAGYRDCDADEPPQYDRLSIDGAAWLAGALRIEFMEPFVPRPGDEFAIVCAASLEVAFSDVQCPDCPANGLGVYVMPPWTPADCVRIHFYAADCVPDFDDSGAVDLADLAIQLSHFGRSGTATRGEGDCDSDRDVDLGDLATLLAAFGETCP